MRYFFLFKSIFKSPAMAPFMVVLLLCMVPLLGMGGDLYAQSENNPSRWHSHTKVAKNVMKKFKSFDTYRAHFRMISKIGRRQRIMSGTIYYKKPAKIRFAFSAPAGNLMVSNGKLLWIYIRKLNASGKQDLRLKKKNENGRSVFIGVPGPGLTRLFRKYHYSFDTLKKPQPRMLKGKSVFVLKLEQREKIGGFEFIKLYIDSSTFLIVRAVAESSSGRTTDISFSDVKLNQPLEGKLFQYDPGNTRVVDNPLVNE